MKKFKLGILAANIMFASTGVNALEAYNGKIMAMSGAGLASGDFSYGGLLNPALAANFTEDDDFDINLNIGVLASDEDELIDNADDLVDIIDDIDGLDPSLVTGELTDLRDTLLDIDGATARVNGGASVQFSFPNELVATSVFITANAAIGAATIVDPDDIALLDALIAGTITDPIDETTLETSVLATGVLTSEVGITFAKKFTIAGQEVAFGISPKHQTVETIIYLERIADFDSDEFDSDEYTEEESNFNVDLGVQTSFDHWKFGATLKNVIENEYDMVDISLPGDPVREAEINDRVVTISPLLTLGTAYRNDWITVAFDIDANGIEEPVTQEDVQIARAGIEFDAFQWAQLRFGYRHDLEDTFEDTISAGIGLSPFDVFNLDIAAMTGDNDTLGAAIQLGVQF